MRLVLIGRRSFIAKRVMIAAEAAGVEATAIGRDDDLTEHIKATDTIVNFALDPAYRSAPYKEEYDRDLAAARTASSRGARTLMLSTRRVYPAGWRWDAREECPARGDETCYGQNKARTEDQVLALGADNTVLRIANVFGMEYDPSGQRRTFFAQMMRDLRNEGIIRFDMHPQTRRDFIPIDVCAAAIVQAATAPVPSILNLGSGFPTPCGELAECLIEGFGSGELHVEAPVVRDEFFLNMDCWQSRFGQLLRPETLRDICFQLGRRLRCEKY